MSTVGESIVKSLADYGVVRTAEVIDPAGNTIVFAQEVAQTPTSDG